MNELIANGPKTRLAGPVGPSAKSALGGAQGLHPERFSSPEDILTQKLLETSANNDKIEEKYEDGDSSNDDTQIQPPTTVLSSKSDDLVLSAAAWKSVFHDKYGGCWTLDSKY